jgi:hypothetical protein
MHMLYDDYSWDWMPKIFSHSNENFVSTSESVKEGELSQNILNKDIFAMKIRK